jgi:mannose-6-phosphate isomerase
MKAYPLKSVPVFMERIWGGRRLQEVFGKELPPGEKIGESWEIADLPEGKSTIGNGPLRGQTLGEVFRRYTEEIAGTRDLGHTFVLRASRPLSRLAAGEQKKQGQDVLATCPEAFPLLIKFLDAEDVLSVQVHPDPETCRRMGSGQPKTECWYIIQAEPGAVIYKGLKKGVTREQFIRAVETQDVASLLAAVPVHAGECHYLPAGTVHALAAGLLIAEVQTPSDTTYRVFDWNRVDYAGKPRPLHIEEALESIHFDLTPDKLPVTTVGRLVDSEYFKVDKGVGWAVPTISPRPGKPVGTAHPTSVSLAPGCMRALICITGSGVIVSKDVEPVEFKAGDCLLIPAAFEGAVQFTRDSEYLVVTI